MRHPEDAEDKAVQGTNSRVRFPSAVRAGLHRPGSLKRPLPEGTLPFHVVDEMP